jgi:hypothetical protein
LKKLHKFVVVISAQGRPENKILPPVTQSGSSTHSVGPFEGALDGTNDGLNEGKFEGINDGTTVGSLDGTSEGSLLGISDGESLGALLGESDGTLDG